MGQIWVDVEESPNSEYLPMRVFETQGAEVVAAAIRVSEVSGGEGPHEIVGWSSEDNLWTIDATRTEGFHSIGPGLELESARIGDAVLTVYATGRAYSLLGSRGFDLQTTESWENNVTTPPREPSTVTSTYERDPWHFSVGVGIRFLWRPE